VHASVWFGHVFFHRGGAYFKRIFHHRALRVLRVTANNMTRAIIGAAIDVHRELGPGLLESSYESCLAWDLVQRGLTVERQKAVPLIYHGVQMDCGYRLDLLVNDTVIIEVKAVERIEGIHTATVMTYLKLTRRPLALLINFHVPLLRDGIRRIVL
jgi:GxxExxY protein